MMSLKTWKLDFDVSLKHSNQQNIPALYMFSGQSKLRKAYSIFQKIGSHNPGPHLKAVHYFMYFVHFLLWWYDWKSS